MSDEVVLCQLTPPVAVLTLNRPDSRNALSRSLIDGLYHAFERVGKERGVRCVVLTGAGTAFCAGMDLAELRQSISDRRATSAVWDDAVRLAKLYDLIYTFPLPTIAAVNGAAVAGGAGLVSVCDLAVSVPTARFGYPEVRRGLVAAMVMPHLLRLVGERMARYLLLTGELIDAPTAQASGFINAVVPESELMSQAQNWVLALAEGGPEALSRTKELLASFSHQAVSVEKAAHESAAPRLSEECEQGLEAFFAKRPAPWAMKKG
jgi:methylglutaconyl-CoA hydratase